MNELVGMKNYRFVGFSDDGEQLYERVDKKVSKPKETDKQRLEALLASFGVEFKAHNRDGWQYVVTEGFLANFSPDGKYLGGLE